jgi:hypothetical protein
MRAGGGMTEHNAMKVHTVVRGLTYEALQNVHDVTEVGFHKANLQSW